MKLYVDDMREAPTGWELVKTYEEAMNIIATGKVTHLSLDHDLGGVSPTGYDILKRIEHAVVRVGFKPPENIMVHSDNPYGRQQMKQVIESINKIRERKDVTKRSIKQNR